MLANNDALYPVLSILLQKGKVSTYVHPVHKKQDDGSGSAHPQGWHFFTAKNSSGGDRNMLFSSSLLPRINEPHAFNSPSPRSSASVARLGASLLRRHAEKELQPDRFLLASLIKPSSSSSSSSGVCNDFLFLVRTHTEERKEEREGGAITRAYLINSSQPRPMAAARHVFLPSKGF